MTTVRRAFAPVDAALLRLRDSLTPGQRWTAVAALALALALVGFGSPERVLFQDGVTSPAGRATPAAAPAPSVTGVDSEPTDVALPGSSSGIAPTAEPSGTAPEPRPASPGLVALVAGDPGAPRGEAAMAQAFLDARHLDAPVIAIDDGEDVACAAAKEALAEVALASVQLPAELRECLVDAGITVLAHDTLGSKVARSSGGAVVATRWGIDHALREVGRWGRSESLRGRVGVVATADLKVAVEESMRHWRALGIDVETVVYVGDGDGSGSSEGDAVRELASHGVQVVVLAVPVDVQRQIAALGAVLLGSPRYVVADAFDAVWDESYAPVFDGAIAYTTARGLWFGRAHGETAQQAACRSTWEEASTPGVMLASETLRVYAWCAMTELAARAVSGGVASLRVKPYESPLTSKLVLEDGAFGPADWAVIVWRSSCSCWTEREAFGRR